MIPTTDHLALVAGRKPNANMGAVVDALAVRGVVSGLDRPHRLAHFLGQVAHESAGFHYDREIWGPTKAQARYDVRTDLGNTAARDGDGKLYMGRGPIQLTGKSNYLAFTAWARRMDRGAPDFAADPEKLLTTPWEGLSAIWFWERAKLNAYADANNIEMVTRRINGGLNGYADRLRLYTRAALVLLGWKPTDVRPFQKAAELDVDGVAGPATRGALHARLVALP